MVVSLPPIIIARSCVADSHFFFYTISADKDVCCLSAKFNKSFKLAHNHDLIFGMCWRWGYSSSKADIERLWCFCPHDDTELLSEGFYSQSFRCETCKRKFGPFEDTQGDLFGMVKRQIHRKLRSGEWKAIVEKFKSEGCHQ